MCDDITLTDHGPWRRLIIHDQGKDVSHLSYAPQPVRLGPAAAVRMAGIGGVGTDPTYRRQGLARRVFARSLEEMRAEGYACAGLYTGADIIAHRLYRQFGFVDTVVAQAAAKLLNPPQFLRARLADLLRGDHLPEEVRTWRAHLQMHLLEHPPTFLRISHQEVELLPQPPARVDLTVALSTRTLLGLVWDHLTIDYAASARLIEWQGEEAHWRTLAAAFAAHHKILLEGD